MRRREGGLQSARGFSLAFELPRVGLTGGGGEFTAATMVSALWRHGPRMLDQMKSKGISCPRFNAAEMANLIAYLKKGE